MICLYLKIPEKFVRLTLQGEFWVVHLQFVSMVKFKVLAHLPHPVVSGLILFLHSFAAFAYYVIDSFVPITPFPIMLRLIYVCLNIIAPYGVVLCCY